MRRHATLRTPEEFRAFLRRETPRHVYYSSAYYQRPAAPTMAEKGWQGADLIFDLDSDHLRGAESLDYAGQLALVKTRLVALVDDFLFGDFGIDPASTSFVFSGGRGYHVHVRDDRFRPLSSPERRELVDYVLGTGFDPMMVIEERRTDVRSGRTAASVDEVGDTGRVGTLDPRTRTLAPPDAPGWRGRTTRALLEMLRRWEEQGSKVAADEMTRYGVAPPKARRYAKLLIDQGGAAKIRTTSPSTSSNRPSRRFPRGRRASGSDRGPGRDRRSRDDRHSPAHPASELPARGHGLPGRAVGEGRDHPLRPVPGCSPHGVERIEHRRPVPRGGPLPIPGRDGALGPRRDQRAPYAVALFLVLRGEAELRASPG